MDLYKITSFGVGRFRFDIEILNGLSIVSSEVHQLEGVINPLRLHRIIMRSVPLESWDSQLSKGVHRIMTRCNLRGQTPPSK